MGAQTQLEPTESTFFATRFRQLRGFQPYPWQTKLFLTVLAGYAPELVYIPTGGGKTEIITVWLLATLYQIQQTGTTATPRRLYMV
jgi:CRISPR-associated endonuclease/helicase Cas3